MNICLIILLLFAGVLLRFLLYTCLLLWAYLECCDWGNEILNLDPGFLGLALLKPILVKGINNKIKVVQLKSHIELFICFISIFGFFFGYCAPIFPLLYIQIIRFKFVVNLFTIKSCNLLDERILKVCIPAPIYNFVILNIKLKLLNFLDSSSETISKDKTNNHGS